MVRGRDKVVLLGLMSKLPVAGVVWQTMQYLVGLERLGYETYYVEAHGRTPSNWGMADVGEAGAARFIQGVMSRFGFDHRWAYHAVHTEANTCYGMSVTELERLYASAALVINLHGGTRPRDEHVATGRLIYVETDPVETQIELHSGLQRTFEFLRRHRAYFTFGECYGTPQCRLPVCDEFPYRPTRQPVVMDFWSPERGGGDRFTTIGNWRQPWREVTFGGETYHWSKHFEFMKVIDLPQRTAQQFELALSSYTSDDQQLLEANGWRVRDAMAFSLDLDHYRDYIIASRAEFTVAKDQNVRFRTGWFSDRTVTYLAAGRPAITQDTGFSAVLPTGEGLFAFTTIDEAHQAVCAINDDYPRHCRAAAAIAGDYFDYQVVLPPLLQEVGL